MAEVTIYVETRPARGQKFSIVTDDPIIWRTVVMRPTETGRLVCDHLLESTDKRLVIRTARQRVRADGHTVKAVVER